MCNGHSGYLYGYVDQSQRFYSKMGYIYSGAGMFNWYYLSSPPPILRRPRFDLEL
jgi:hypothetical protein